MCSQPMLHCDIMQFLHPSWDRIDDRAKEAIWDVLREMYDFVGSEPTRRGFAGVNRVQNTVAGFYLQENLREGLVGDRPDTLVRQQHANFEKLFFAWLLDVGFIVIQRTTISGYVAMNYTSMRQQFEHILAEVLSRAGVATRRVQLAKFFKHRSQEEMREIFFGNISVHVHVTELHRKAVPESVQLANPDPSEELLLKRIFNRDYEQLDEEVLRAASGQDLRRTKTGKAAVSAGDVNEVEIQLPNGAREKYATEQDERILVPVDDSKDLVTAREIQDVVEIVERRIRIPTAAFRSDVPQDLGPLFKLLGGGNG